MVKALFGIIVMLAALLLPTLHPVSGEEQNPVVCEVCGCEIHAINVNIAGLILKAVIVAAFAAVHANVRLVIAVHVIYVSIAGLILKAAIAAISAVAHANVQLVIAVHVIYVSIAGLILKAAIAAIFAAVHANVRLVTVIHIRIVLFATPYITNAQNVIFVVRRMASALHVPSAVPSTLHHVPGAPSVDLRIV